MRTVKTVSLNLDQKKKNMLYTATLSVPADITLRGCTRVLPLGLESDSPNKTLFRARVLLPIEREAALFVRVISTHTALIS